MFQNMLIVQGENCLLKNWRSCEYSFLACVRADLRKSVADSHENYAEISGVPENRGES
jgi:hypothetical protein